MNELESISPIDGRYKRKTEHLKSYFSEFALIKYRLRIEVEYFIFLSENNFFSLSIDEKTFLRNVYKNFTIAQAEIVKSIESKTNHDVKSVEYFLKEIVKNDLKSPHYEWVHFGLTSQDINNTAIPNILKDFISLNYLPKIKGIKDKLFELSNEYKEVPMLARTHGQSATPTLLGKEFMVFVERINSQLEQLYKIPISAKFGGATGGLNAHYVSYPNFDWNSFSSKFLNQLGLNRSKYTTQIEHYDNMSALFDVCKRINTILIDFTRDIWQYISMEYFKQIPKIGEIGSSAMPHKVNPIDFENAEGNLGIANSNFEFLSSKLPISRLQRDLTDSTVLRNIGVGFSHTIISLLSIESGLKKISLNIEKINEDLDNNWIVVSEAIQTILRRENYETPYEKLKDLTRGKTVSKKEIHEFVDSLGVNNTIKEELKRITPHNYVGKFIFDKNYDRYDNSTFTFGM